MKRAGVFILICALFICQPKINLPSNLITLLTQFGGELCSCVFPKRELLCMFHLVLQSWRASHYVSFRVCMYCHLAVIVSHTQYILSNLQFCSSLAPAPHFRCTGDIHQFQLQIDRKHVCAHVSWKAASEKKLSSIDIFFMPLFIFWHFINVHKLIMRIVCGACVGKSQPHTQIGRGRKLFLYHLLRSFTHRFQFDLTICIWMASRPHEFVRMSDAHKIHALELLKSLSVIILTLVTIIRPPPLSFNQRHR